MFLKPRKIPAVPAVLLKGARVAARPPALTDWPQWAEVRGRNRDFLKPYEPTWPENCLSRGFFERRLQKQAQDWRLGLGYSFLIFRNDSGALLGGININNVCRGAAQYATLGYWLDEREQGKGYMIEALRLVIGYGFSHLQLHRFNAGCLAGNERSARLLERLGFAEEGFAKKFVQIDGRWQDHRLFGLPCEDWQQSSTKE